MPEDVTPPEELARPSSKLVQMVSPAPSAVEPAAGEPMLTETMGDLYLKQGFRSEAAEVYRKLLSQRPADEALRAKLAALESPPALAASAEGSESVGSWLRRLAGASLGAEPPPPPPPPPPAEPTPMEAAFTAAEPEPQPQPPGEPARPASEAFSLDQIFGSEAGAAAPPPPESSPAAPPPTPPGASFDEFFGSVPPQDTGPGPEPAEAPPKGDDDLSSFNAWLHGLKR
jgi:hypothetical protein